ncbi:PQQ enzyme repeat-containing protein [Terriglobus roseus DSM 18391]|uniref:PQQ enzyme repeat-containing protein n=1 Tax=Terriglobus roseus (strain DSM 18391 / NRRL B-41598 / KBS 63) TaxID=926566 RepID=I3ZJH1_TERRK|nr:PQQ-binding-like beta-propeller repeat protein [Terriglobus roseus]AFL89389.1 PQQ enzyme repeat-containing protein [Terriglobus roseus DSM 18391]
MLRSLFSVLMSVIVFSVSSFAQTTAAWTSVGQGLTNLRSQPAEKSISALNVGRLAVKWAFTTVGDVTATPTVSGGVVYFPDSAGNLYAVNATTGIKIWQQTITSYVGMPNAIARVSPAVYMNEIILGDNLSVTEKHAGAHVFAVNQADGKLLWITQVDANKAAIITGSPVVYNNVAYVGISSEEEGLTQQKGYACCTFRGSIVALNATTGAKLWQTYMTPDNNGQPNQYSGAAIWSPPAIDVGRNLLFTTTGNNYSVPSSVQACQAAANAAHNTTKRCALASDMFDAIVALNLTTGEPVWWQRPSVYDTYNLACHLTPPGPNCPTIQGLDYDFGGGGPNLFNNVVGAGQKSGVFNMFDAAKGKYIWSVPVGPGGQLGGILWGTASDGSRIFVASANSAAATWTLASGQSINWGFWSALDMKTGKILWQTPEPTHGASAISSMSTANGVVYVGSLDAAGYMYALSSATGQVLWSFPSGGSVFGAPAIVDGTLYWGSGYKRFGGTGNNKLYAFYIP